MLGLSWTQFAHGGKTVTGAGLHYNRGVWRLRWAVLPSTQGDGGTVQMRIFGLIVVSMAVMATSAQLLSVRLAVVGILLGLVMMAIAVIDADAFIIPDWLSLPAIPLGLLASGRLLHPDVDDIVDASHLIGAFAGGEACG